MSTLGSLPADKPNLELTFAWPQNPAGCHKTTVTGLVTMSLAQLLEGRQCPLRVGTLVLVTGRMPFRLRGQIADALQTLLHQMALQRCAALVVTGQPGVHQPFPQPMRDLSDELAIPLMATTAAPEAWLGLHESIHNDLLARAERRAAQLNMLMQQLPAQLADIKAMERIADWLAQTLDAQVMVSESERVLAASPATAAEHLAHAIIRQSVDGPSYDGPSAPHTHLISLAPATGADTVLAVVRRTPFDEAERRLLRHGAKILGLVDQARREFRVTNEASHAARMAAAELLLAGEPAKARRVMATLTPGLLDPATARAYILETTAALRDAVVRRCHATVKGRALVVADPRHARRILIVNPVRPGSEAESCVAGDLVRVVASLGQGISLGGSGVYSLSLIPEALSEALTAQRFATHQPDSVALSAQNTDLVSLLPEREALRWAHSLLHPLMRKAEQWIPLREALPAALTYPYTVAARRLALHRNTVTRRVARAADLLQLDLSRVTNRVAVGLALELVTQRDAPERSETLTPPVSPTLTSLLAAPPIAAWANTLLHTARDDRRDLLATAQSWLSHDTHIESTARALELSEVTVRSHLRAIEEHMSRDLASMAGLRDLLFALHIETGRPEITDSCAALRAA
ncbi:hypothetical protein GCM10010306_090740 [Streptomyces umbrinus]|uniref:helix-turn-helix domain-containing protein n=1 Tax=Streptomyces umbrinus TaxID=67370 RepID=UPI001673AA28|nr:helix-turn-helix domain-containing protein [Streptomyces umbrinus]GHB82079.1 hypothetical protein GCM10010306_090740 [Streptomyces umbrinus]